AEPTNAERNGTADAPVPVSIDMRTPVVAVGGRPAFVTNVTTRDENRLPARSFAVDERRAPSNAVTRATPPTTNAIPITPRPITVQSAWKPASGSARRATPTGNSDDAAS